MNVDPRRIIRLGLTCFHWTSWKIWSGKGAVCARFVAPVSLGDKDGASRKIEEGMDPPIAPQKGRGKTSGRFEWCPPRELVEGWGHQDMQ